MSRSVTGLLRCAFPLLVAFVFQAPAAFAQTITNGDFENVLIPFTSNPAARFSTNPLDIPGWTHSVLSPGDALIWQVGYCDSGGCITTAGDGTSTSEQFVTLGGGAGASGSADWQTTITGLVPGNSYVVSFDVSTETNLAQSMTVSVVGSLTPSETVTPIPTTLSYWQNWVPETYTFVAPGANPVLDFGVTNTRQDMGLDAVSVAPATPVVPEPSSLLLLGTGLAGMFGALRRKCRR